MRLLQLVTGPRELIDLHPNLTVVTGLDAAGRGLLVDAVVGLASGRVNGQEGLLEAHGVLFDLDPDALALLDISAKDVLPVVTIDDLPVPRQAPPVPDRPAAVPVRAAIEERWAAAEKEDRVARVALAAALEAVDRARAATVEDEHRPAEPAPEVPQSMLDEVARLAAARAEATAAREQIESATAEVRARREAAAARCSAVAARLEAARLASDPDAEQALEDAVAALAELEAEVEAELETAREAEVRGEEREEEPPAERLERLGREIEVLEKRLVAFGPTEVEQVASRLEPLRSSDGSPVAPMPEAIVLADELAALDAELVATEAMGGTPGAGLAEGRARLDDARQALIEAEQAVRRPELDRDVVDRLEQAHADLLQAIEKADRRFAGARARRRVDALRSAEVAILDELGLASYSDYMMGSSLLHVDPVKEAALDDARAELSAAEDAWQALEAETERELERAEWMERRRELLDEARALLGHSVPPGSVIEELRAMRVEAEPPPELTVALREALDAAGVALGEEDLAREDLLVVAETWLTEAAEAADREAALRADLDGLRAQHAAVLAGADAPADSRVDATGPERLAAARERRSAAEDRHLAHLAAEREVVSLAEGLAVAAALERDATGAAAEADEALADAVVREAEAVAAHEWAEAELAEASVATSDEPDGDRAGVDPEAVPPPLAAALAEAETRLAASAAALAELVAEREQATAPEAEPDDEPREQGGAEEVEWYLLARLAAQRSVSLGGSLPLLLDDALAGFGAADIEHVLGRLERMAQAVQVIVVSDDPAAAAWAARAGADRAAVVRPQAAGSV